MSSPYLILGTRADWEAAARYKVRFRIASDLVLQTKDGVNRPFTMLATRLELSWSWSRDEWRLSWYFHGHRYRKTKGDWSPHEQGFMTDTDIDLPAWVLPLIAANAPTRPPTAESEAS